MRRFPKFIAVVGVIALFAACGDPGPISISIAPQQMASGENRALTAGDAAAVYEPVQEVNYEISGTLPPVFESAMSFSFQPRSDNKLALRGMADALGVYGDFVKVNKNLLTIGYDNATGAGLQLWVDASGGWWSYNSGAASMSVTSPTPCDSSAPEDCVLSAPDQQPPAKNLPTQAEAIKQVSDLLVLSRAKPNNYVFSVEQTSWTTHVTGRLRLWDMTSNIEVNVLFGENSKIISASGPMVAVKTAQTYPLITPEEGLSRLKDPMFAAGGAVRRLATDMAAENGSSTTLAPRTVSIVNVHLTLMQVLLSNGTYMLLPSFTYFDKDGEVGVVLAVQDQYLIEGEAPTTSLGDSVQLPMPGTDPDTSGGSLGSSGGEATPPNASTGEAPATTVKPVVELTDDNSIVLMGRSEAEVLRVSENNGWLVRVVQRDKTLFQMTQDYVPNRLNIRVIKGIVTAVTIG